MMTGNTYVMYVTHRMALGLLQGRFTTCLFSFDMTTWLQLTVSHWTMANQTLLIP